jgi:hypothetical protein
MSAAPPPYLVWIDPGGMTGIASLSYSKFWADEYQFQRACDIIADLCCLGRHLAIGWERFTIGPNTHKMTRQPEAMEIIGVARYFATRYDCMILPPAAPGERDTATPEMLKALGIWTPGKDDAQSATQHLLAWMLRNKCVPDNWQVKLSDARR